MTAFFNIDEHFRDTVSRDVASMVLGECIGYGTTRAVYVHATDESKIVKVENTAQSFCNVYEHEVWDHIKDTEFAKWFAPVEYISPSGTVLVMRRTEAVPVDLLPKQLPVFFTDIKAENFGRLNGRVVCHDYGYHQFIERGMSKRMRKVKPADWKNGAS
jgi:hypothetical protein